jgi:hypothetical protein
MDTCTEITTAARRIARESNSRPAEVTSAYDTDGRHVDAWSTGMYHTGNTAPACAVILHGTRSQVTDRRLTWREAQDLLDAAAYAVSHPDEDNAAADYLAAIDFERRR